MDDVASLMQVPEDQEATHAVAIEECRRVGALLCQRNFLMHHREVLHK